MTDKIQNGRTQITRPSSKYDTRKNYSYRTEQSYVHWIKRYVINHHKRHPSEMGEIEIQKFLTHLAVDKNVAASTQNQALSAILFLYKRVLKSELKWISNFEFARKPKMLPVVFTLLHYS